jgi:hypothetical protein
MRRCWVLLIFTALAVLLAAILAPAALAVSRPQTHTHPLVVTHPRSGPQPRIVGGAPGATPTTSANWSGYDDSTDGPFTSVTATWTQPAISPAGATFTDAAFWVGLDGDNSTTVEQIGSEGYSEGAVGYDAWYEMYPNAPVTIGMSIHPGDVLTGSVVETGVATFTLSLVNHTTGKSFQTIQVMSVPPALASAEVIAEAPTDGNGDVVPLGQFGLVSFSDCAFNGQPIAGFAFNQIDMISEYTGALVDRTLALGGDGASFAVTTDLTPPTTQVSGAGSVWHRKPVTLHFRASDNPGGQGVAYTEYSLDGGVTWTKGTSASIPAPADHSADGPHRVLYRSADNVGNLERKRACTVNIDTRPPTPVAKWAGSAVRGTFTALRCYIADPRPGSPTASVTIRIRSARGVLVRKAVLGAVKVDSSQRYVFKCWLPKGTYRFTVAATDAAGNPGTTAAANTLVVH